MKNYSFSIVQIIVLSGLMTFVMSNCASIRNTREDFTVNHSRVSKYGHPKKTSKSKAIKPKNRDVANHKEKKTGSTKILKKASTKRRVIADESVRDDMISYSAKYDGTRYKYGGKNPFGFDCSGFTSFVFKKHDILLPASALDQSKYGDKIPLENVNKGDLLFFKIDRKISHVALVVSHKNDELMMRHASSSSGIMIENYYQSEYWQDRFSHATDAIGDK